jgi:hypothetical protein
MHASFSHGFLACDRIQLTSIWYGSPMVSLEQLSTNGGFPSRKLLEGKSMQIQTNDCPLNMCFICNWMLKWWINWINMVNPNHSMIFRLKVEPSQPGSPCNSDCMSEIDGYVHRIGRCGRAGRMGTAVTFVGGSVGMTWWWPLSTLWLFNIAMV